MANMRSSLPLSMKSCFKRFDTSIRGPLVTAIPAVIIVNPYPTRTSVDNINPREAMVLIFLYLAMVPKIMATRKYGKAIAKSRICS